MDRVSFSEALSLFQDAPLEELRLLADHCRRARNPENKVYYVIDANPNYTNICCIDCKFCAFYRKEHHQDAYLLTIEQLRNKLKIFRDLGVKTILLQGGVHPKVSMAHLTEMVEMTVREFPEVHPHYFSAVEIYSAARVSNISIKNALKMLWDAGQRTIPGGGAEMLSEQIRRKISPKKMGPNGWIDFHRKAHKMGFITTATMMFGHLENPEDIILHLDTLRNAQDETPGFSAFIPWSYKLPNTGLRRLVQKQASKDIYYRILALSRIYLDNFPHIAASWFGEGKEVGKKGLHYGADDFGGTIFDESVHKCAGWELTASEEEIRRLIIGEGFIPVERNSFYQEINQPNS